MKGLISSALALTMIVVMLAAMPALKAQAIGLSPDVANYKVAATAAYAKELPVIDGKIDGIWDITETLDVLNEELELPEESQQASGYTKVLWTEDALYFLNVVRDVTLEGIGTDSFTNQANLWIAETLTEDATYEAVGNYFLLLNSAGNWITKYENGNAAMAAAQKAVQTYDDWYVQEIKMPIMTPGLQYAEGHVIRLEISFEDDWDGDNVRDSCLSWMDAAPYWNNPSVMYGVRLQMEAECPFRAERYGDEDVPAETIAPEATQGSVGNATEPAGEKVPEKDTESDATQEPILTIGADTKNENKSLSTVGIIAIAAAVVVVAAAIVTVVAVKKKG